MRPLEEQKKYWSEFGIRKHSFKFQVCYLTFYVVLDKHFNCKMAIIPILW